MISNVICCSRRKNEYLWSKGLNYNIQTVFLLILPLFVASYESRYLLYTNNIPPQIFEFVVIYETRYDIHFKLYMTIIQFYFIMPPFKKEGVYCFAHVGWLVRTNIVRSLTRELGAQLGMVVGNDE